MLVRYKTVRVDECFKRRAKSYFSGGGGGGGSTSVATNTNI